MPKIIVCYKWVKSEEDLRINPDMSVDLSRAKGKISDYDRNAIETARIVAADTNGEAVGLIFGAADAKPSLKDALARGLKQVYWINDTVAENADGFVTAMVLAAALRKIDDVRLVICSEGASDTYAHQVGPRIGTLLDIPIVSYVVDMKVVGNKLTAIRKLEDSMETVEVDLPAMVTILPEINGAPIPGLKGVLEAAKKPVTEWHIADLAVADEEIVRKTKVTDFKGYAMTRKNIMFYDGGTEEKVNALVSALRKEGVL
jgi:electron transfer flavoprotein beta subunit